MSVYVQDADFTLLHGDVLEQLATLKPGSVHCVVTSPPYWGLRDYGTGEWEGGSDECDHLGAPFRTKSKLNENWGAGYSDVKNAEGREPMLGNCSKCGARRVDQQLGLEPTPDLYVARIVEVFQEVRRVLRDDGTCWINLGDSYASAWACDRRNVIGSGSLEKGKREDRPNRLVGGLKEKDLVGIPWRVAFALQTDGWYLRSDIIWAKPNPMPESVTDRPTKAHEYVFLLTKGPRYFFDQEAVREPATNGERFHGDYGKPGVLRPTASRNGRGDAENAITGRNIRSVWDIATQPYPEAHFATYPEELVRRCVLAGTSERGCCPECGKPWEREVEMTAEYRALLDSGKAWRTDEGKPDAYTNRQPKDHPANVPAKFNTTGWRPACDHAADPIPCTVLDPFLGSGTTAHVARKHGRRSIGIELNPDYCELAAKRMQQQSLLV